MTGEDRRRRAPGLIGDLHAQLDQLERAMGADAGRLKEVEERLRPEWQRAGQAEQRLPMAAVVVVAIALQLVLPARLLLHPVWLLPALEGVLLIGLVATNPRRIDRSSVMLRLATLALIIVVTIANASSAALLVRDLLTGSSASDPIMLLGSGAAIYVTNVIAFALWYWEVVRGGAGARAQGVNPYPDFMFPQMGSPSLAPRDWRPGFADYLYFSFTNATAFSPTDVMPLSKRAKGMMAIQSTVALITVALVIARAVNILR